jgi:hypothetical protein
VTVTQDGGHARKVGNASARLIRVAVPALSWAVVLWRRRLRSAYVRLDETPPVGVMNRWSSLAVVLGEPAPSRQPRCTSRKPEASRFGPRISSPPRSTRTQLAQVRATRSRSKAPCSHERRTPEADSAGHFEGIRGLHRPTRRWRSTSPGHGHRDPRRGPNHSRRRRRISQSGQIAIKLPVAGGTGKYRNVRGVLIAEPSGNTTRLTYLLIP